MAIKPLLQTCVKWQFSASSYGGCYPISSGFASCGVSIAPCPVFRHNPPLLQSLASWPLISRFGSVKYCASLPTWSPIQPGLCMLSSQWGGSVDGVEMMVGHYQCLMMHWGKGDKDRECDLMPGKHIMLINDVYVELWAAQRAGIGEVSYSTKMWYTRHLPPPLCPVTLLFRPWLGLSAVWLDQS